MQLAMSQTPKPDIIHGHAEVFYRDALNVFVRDVVRVNMNSATLVEDLRAGAPTQRIRAALEARGCTEEWIGPWRYGRPEASVNQVTKEYFFPMDVTHKGGPRAGRRETVNAHGRTVGIEQIIWNREYYENLLRKGYSDLYEIHSINAICVGTYISLDHPEIVDPGTAERDLEVTRDLAAFEQSE